MVDVPPTGIPQVLVIDDELGLREMLALGLTRHGYKVAAASSGKQAVELVGAQSFDLVICDIMMAGMTGMEVLAYIKEKHPETEVIMATGHATLETAISAMKLGAYDYISKPYALKALRAVMERALEHRRLKGRVTDLEELNRLKTEFLANTSHELRTPLNCIIGFHSLLLNGVNGPLTPEQTGSIQRADMNSKSLLRMVNNLMDMASLSAGKMQPITKTCDIVRLARDILAELEPLSLAKKLALRSQAPPTCLWITDQSRLRQIIVNLVANAIKFTAEGTVTLRLEAHENPRVLSISVEDTGIGIGSQDMGNLFEQFTQVDGSTTRKHGGSGLGLSICKKSTELLGGTISVQSTPGVGTTFTVLLPERAASSGEADETPRSDVRRAA